MVIGITGDIAATLACSHLRILHLQFLSQLHIEQYARWFSGWVSYATLQKDSLADMWARVQWGLHVNEDESLRNTAEELLPVFLQWQYYLSLILSTASLLASSCH